MKKGFVLASKLVLFAVLLIWILGLIAVGIAVQPSLESAMRTLTGVTTQGFYTFFDAWLWIAIVVVGVFTALKGFRLIGKWCRTKDCKEELEVKG